MNTTHSDREMEGRKWQRLISDSLRSYRSRNPIPGMSYAYDTVVLRFADFEKLRYAVEWLRFEGLKVVFVEDIGRTAVRVGGVGLIGVPALDGYDIAFGWTGPQHGVGAR